MPPSAWTHCPQRRLGEEDQQQEYLPKETSCPSIEGDPKVSVSCVSSFSNELIAYSSRPAFGLRAISRKSTVVTREEIAKKSNRMNLLSEGNVNRCCPLCDCVALTQSNANESCGFVIWLWLSAVQTRSVLLFDKWWMDTVIFDGAGEQRNLGYLILSQALTLLLLTLLLLTCTCFISLGFPQSHLVSLDPTWSHLI